MYFTNIFNALLFLSCTFFVDPIDPTPAVPSVFESNYLSARKKATEAGKTCLIFFSEDNNKSAEWMERVVFPDPQLSNLLSEFICARLNSSDFDGSLIREKMGLTRSPSLALVAVDGSIIARLNQGVTQTKLTEWLQFYIKSENTGKPLTINDPAFETKVAAWSGLTAPTVITAVQDAPKNIDSPAENPKIDATEPSSTTETQREEVVQTPVPVTEPVKEAVAEPLPPESIANNLYTLQAGVFGSAENARILQAKLDKISVGEAFIETLQSNGKPLYKVYTGKYPNEQSANHAMSLLEKQGLKTLVKKL